MIKTYLLCSSITIFAVALCYGIIPDSIFSTLLNLNVHGIEQAHLFRSIAGLYAGMALLWLIGAFNMALQKTAVITEIVFMLGLAVGRLVSIILDGIPNLFFVLFATMEIAAGTWGAFVLCKINKCSEK